MVKFVLGTSLFKTQKYHIQSALREGALIVSGHGQFASKHVTEMQDDVLAIFRHLATWVEEHHGIIGHLKGTLEDSETMLMVSTTGGEIHTQSGEAEKKQNAGVTVSIVLIVFNVSQKELEAQLMQAFEQLSPPDSKNRGCHNSGTVTAGKK